MEYLCFAVYLDCEASYHNLFKSLSSQFPETNQYWCYMKNHGREPCGVRTHDPKVARQKSYPFRHRFPYVLQWLTEI